MPDKIIIIGNSIAALTAIKSIREIDKTSEIHLFGKEMFYPYSRMRLSKGLLSTLQEEKILLQKREWYDDNNVNLYLGTTVVSIDTDKKVIKLFDDSLISYTKLLIATGSRNMEPDIPGIHKSGIYSLRTLQEAWDIMDDINHYNSILIIGGGVQGLETAWALSQMNKKVIIANSLDRLMNKQLDEKASSILEKSIKSNGVQVLTNVMVNEITGGDSVEGFKTEDGDFYSCDAAIYSIGTKPNIDLLKDTPIKTNRGVIVNDRMETNIQGIYAAGDVAEYNDHIFGLWSIAMAQGKTAGYNLAGKDEVYSHTPPMTNLSAFGLSLFSIGIVDDNIATDIVLEDKSDKNIYHKILIKDNKIIGAIVVGSVKSSPALKASIEKDISLEGIDYKTMSFDDIIKALKDKISQV